MDHVFQLPLTKSASSPKRERATSPPPYPPSPVTTNSSLSASIVQSPSRRFSSPARKSVQYGDRFIPSRVSSNLEDAFDIMDQRQSPAGTPDKNSSPRYSNASNMFNESTSSSYNRDAVGGSQNALNNLIRSELLGHQASSSPLSGNTTSESRNDSTGTSENMFKFHSPNSSSSSGSYSVYGGGHTPYANSHDSPSSNSFMPMSVQGKGHFPQVKATRKISKVPFKILDAPALQDDFYLNLVDWSSSNLLSVGLGTSVYLWSACTSKVTKLCDLGANDNVTSVSWARKGSLLSIGSNTGKVQVWDAGKCTKVCELVSHNDRVGTSSWNSSLLATGGKDRTILIQDLRCGGVVRELTSHKQEICGLKWSFDDRQLASGGNDNKLFVWGLHGDPNTPIYKFSDHSAAVKAVAWSPHQHGLLASGGGTADRHIRFWNTLTGTPLQKVDTGSQVCNLMWSTSVNEIVSTHGYSLNQVILWRYGNMQKLATLTGHTYRVLYLAMSPDGQTIVTGAGDETLRFWNVFPSQKNRSGDKIGSSSLYPSSSAIR